MRERVTVDPEVEAEWQATLDEYQRQLEAQFGKLRGDAAKPEREGYWTNPAADRHSKFAGGFVSGKYSPLSQQHDKDAIGPAHVAGSPLAAGGKYEHGGWKEGTPAAPPPAPIAPPVDEDDDPKKKDSLSKAKPFEEDKHPRAEDGKFGSGGAGESTPATTPAATSEYNAGQLEMGRLAINYLVDGWSKNSWGRQAIELRALANVAAGKSFDANLTPAQLALSRKLDISEPTPAQVDHYRLFQTKAAEQFDARFPNGTNVMRGVHGGEGAVLAKTEIGATIEFLQPLISTTSKPAIACKFAMGQIGDIHNENVVTTDRAIVKITGVRGRHQLMSYHTMPGYFSGYAYQQETVVDGNTKWKLTAKDVDKKSGLPIYTFAPVDDEPPSPKKPIKPPAKKAR